VQLPGPPALARSVALLQRRQHLAPEQLDGAHDVLAPRRRRSTVRPQGEIVAAARVRRTATKRPASARQPRFDSGACRHGLPTCPRRRAAVALTAATGAGGRAACGAGAAGTLAAVLPDCAGCAWRGAPAERRVSSRQSPRRAGAVSSEASLARARASQPPGPHTVRFKPTDQIHRIYRVVEHETVRFEVPATPAAPAAPAEHGEERPG
jgi:hypothetical protein